MQYLKEIERLRLANALEMIADLCQDHDKSCLGCPLVVKSKYNGDDYCIFDCDYNTVMIKIEELRGE